MKRTILVLLAVFALAIVAVVATQAVEIDGAPRMLLIAGAVVLLVGVVDGLRRPTLGHPTLEDAEAVGSASTGDPTVATSLVAASLNDAVIDLREPPATIDLREAHGPISDEEAHAMIMVAVSQGALAEIRPRLHAVPDMPQALTSLAS